MPKRKRKKEPPNPSGIRKVLHSMNSPQSKGHGASAKRKRTDNRTPRSMTNHQEPTRTLKHRLKGRPSTGRPLPVCSEESFGMFKTRPGCFQDLGVKFVLIHLVQETWPPFERVSAMAPARLLSGMYQEWKIVQHMWCRSDQNTSFAQHDWIKPD